MNDTESLSRAATPRHLWIAGIVSLLWNAFGSYDYVMTQIRDPGYLKMFPSEIIDWIDTFPVWATAAWALGVWGSLAGSVLLLMRSRHAVTAFGMSLAGALVSFGYQFLGTDMPDAARTPGMLAMTVAILGAIVLQWWYARGQRVTGVLR